MFTLYDFLILGRFHQYDGVIRVKENKGLSYYYHHYTGQEDSRYRKELHKDAALSADVFLPVWQTVNKPSPGCSGEEMIMRIRSVLKGLQKTYWMLNITDDKFLQPFREVISACRYLVDVSFFLAHLSKGNVSFCHHLASVVCLLFTF